MSKVPGNLKYTKSHEWVEIGSDNVITVGITDHAQELLGDLVYVEVPEEGASTKTGDGCAVVESVKAASDVYAPASGEVTEVNTALADAPELINQDCYGEGWMFRIKVSDAGALNGLMDAAAYKEFAASEEH